MYFNRWDRLMVPEDTRGPTTLTSVRTPLWTPKGMSGHGPPRLTRRRFLLMSAATTAFFAVGCQPVMPEPAAGLPKSIPFFMDMGAPVPPLHLYLPTDFHAPGAPNIAAGSGDPSTIYDFNGTVGVIEALGGTGTDNEGNALYWEADYRFLQGEYIDSNENRQQGIFAFM